jgi:hypothetical protein
MAGGKSGFAVPMKESAKHIARAKDDTLFGLLSLYKASHTYVRVLESEAEDAIVLQVTSNPGNFNLAGEETYRGYRILRRLEIGVPKISLKYLAPESLVAVLGPLLELNIPYEKAVIMDRMKKDGIYSIETSLRYKTKVLQGVKKLLGMSPQKRYELLEKYLSGYQE